MTISSELADHLTNSSSLFVALRITAGDGEEIRICTGTRDKTIDGDVYIAYPFEPTQLQETNGLESDNLEVLAAYSGLFNAATIRAKKWLNARVEYRVMNYEDLSQGHLQRKVTFIGESVPGKLGARIQLNTLSAKLDQEIGRTYQANCDAQFGDSRCGKALTGNSVQGYKIRTNAHLTNVLNKQQFSLVFDENIKPSTPAVTVAPNDFYELGTIEFLEGENTAVKMDTLLSSGNAITLFLPLSYLPIAGENVIVTAGCNHTIEVCRGVYANAVNYRGFFPLPGRDKLFNFPD